MEWEEAHKTLREIAINGCYLELILEDGSRIQGKYGLEGPGYGVNIYTSKEGWNNYEFSQIKSISRIPIKQSDFSEELWETITECEDWEN